MLGLANEQLGPRADELAEAVRPWDELRTHGRPERRLAARLALRLGGRRTSASTPTQHGHGDDRGGHAHGREDDLARSPHPSSPEAAALAPVDEPAQDRPRASEVETSTGVSSRDSSSASSPRQPGAVRRAALGDLAALESRT